MLTTEAMIADVQDDKSEVVKTLTASVLNRLMSKNGHQSLIP